jgi:hypothetical protein
MKEVTVRPAIFKNREDRDQARALLARKLLWQLIASAKSHMGAVRWHNEGGVELEEFAICLDAGRLHPLLTQWRQKRGGAANRSPFSAREQHAQRFIYLATVALERVHSLTRAEAREIVAKKVARLFDHPPSAKAIEHWQANQPPLSPADWQVIAAAIHRSRVDQPGGRERLVDYFVGLAHAVMTPGTLIGTE